MLKKVAKVPDNCFTWARAKLKMVDVELPEYPVDACIATPTLYANHPIDRETEQIEEADRHIER